MSLEALQQQMRLLQEQMAQMQQGYEQTVSRLRQELQETKQENALLRQKLDALARRYFGKKNEEISSAQFELLLSGSEWVEVPNVGKTTTPVTKRSRSGKTRVRTPDNLEVVRTVIDPDVVREEPAKWKEISQEVSRQLDYQPGKFFWQETIRPKYVRRDNRQVAPVVAAAPQRSSGMAAPGLMAQLLVNKFSYHLPFYRQQQMFQERHGVYIARQQMVLWMKQGVSLLEGIAGCIKTELRQSPYVQVDETPIDYLNPGQGHCSKGYLWIGYVPKKCVVFEWHASRAAECLVSLLGKDFKGKIQCDGYGAYPAYAMDKPEIKLSGCWSHLR